MVEDEAIGPVLPWSAVEHRAIPMFDLHHSERGLAWAKQAWACLTEEELTTCEDPYDEALTYIRLLSLALIHDEYSTVAWNTSSGRTAVQLAVGMDFSTFVLGVFYGIEGGHYTGTTEDEMRAAAIAHLADEFRWEVGMALVKHFGGVDGLHGSLWHIRYDPNDPTTPNAFSDEGPQKRAIAYLEDLIILKEKEEE
jgi:hypothetical protein